jgi:hypothetical protein
MSRLGSPKGETSESLLASRVAKEETMEGQGWRECAEMHQGSQSWGREKGT